ncbi:hypothetical protein B0T17DRAFT_614405 [Bombardia bombarda]|uniref:Uncharacterized protein n=1 Tax=Bombardia bombarda TaxID=252184 RepID=A0AA39X716_9PEZI|nr:hypothetical protein B0T17DRAFT_614405 [Bombardia bombarda]
MAELPTNIPSRAVDPTDVQTSAQNEGLQGWIYVSTHLTTEVSESPESSDFVDDFILSRNTSLADSTILASTKAQDTSEVASNAADNEPTASIIAFWRTSVVDVLILAESGKLQPESTNPETDCAISSATIETQEKHSAAKHHEPRRWAEEDVIPFEYDDPYNSEDDEPYDFAGSGARIQAKIDGAIANFRALALDWPDDDNATKSEESHE